MQIANIKSLNKMLQHKPFLLFISILYISRENQMHFRTDIKTCKDTKTQRCCFTPLGFCIQEYFVRTAAANP